MARLEHVKGQADTARVVFQRLVGGERLKEIARAWGVPAGLFVHWYTTEHARDYAAALEARAEELAHEAVEIADEQSEVEKPGGGTYDPDVARDRLRVDTRLKIAGKWNRKRYGDEQEAVRTTPVVIQIANLRGAPLEVAAPQTVEGDPPK